MTTIYLVRHAHSTYSPDEIARPLSERGTADAKQLISLFREVQPDYIYTSPYRRAIETVQPVAEHYGLPIEEAEAFQERLLAPGQLDDFQQAVEYVWNHPDKNPYGGESNDIAQYRVVSGTQQLIRKHTNETVVVGTHGNIMVLLMQHFDPAYDYSFWSRLAMPAVYRLVFDGERCLQIEEVSLASSSK